MPPLAPNAWLRYDTVRRELDRIAGRREGSLGEVLEIGCGQGGVGARLAARSRYTGVDLDETSLAVARGRIADAGGDGRILCGWLDDVLEPEERFDLVCAFEVLEHIRDDAAALRMWGDRLKPGGWLLVSVPAHSDRYSSADRMAGHFRRYDPGALDTALRETGYDDVRVRCYGMPLGFVLERGRNAIAARRGFPATPVGIPSYALDTYGRTARPDETDEALWSELEHNTRSSGRLLQPTALMGPAVQAATWPFRRAQQGFPGRGPGLLGAGQRPA